MLKNNTALDRKNNFAPEKKNSLMERNIVARLGAFLLTAVILFSTVGSSFGQRDIGRSSNAPIESLGGKFDQNLLSQVTVDDAAVPSLIYLAEKSEVEEDEYAHVNSSLTSTTEFHCLSFQVNDLVSSFILIESRKYILFHSLKIPN